MKAEDFDALLISGIKRREGLHQRKRADYANADDVLSNFKRVAAAAAALEISVHTPIGYSVFMELMKLDRKWNLIRKGVAPSNESLTDTTDDQITYACLSEGIIQEGDDLSSIFLPGPNPEYPEEVIPFRQPSPHPKVFVAAPWPNRGNARFVMDILEAHGATITYDWTQNEVDLTSPTAAEELSVLSEKDVAGVLAADWLIALPEKHDPLSESDVSGRGTWAEVGLAIGRNIPVLLWPTCNLLDLGCIYAVHPQVTVVDDFLDLCRHLWPHR